MSIDKTSPPEPTGATVTRSEEELSVTTAWTATGRVRISKRITTVTETRTFELRREELVIEELDPPSGATPQTERPEATSAEFVLQREELVVTKRPVPYERVVVHTDLTTEQHTVTDTLRRERVEVDGDATDRPPSGRPTPTTQGPTNV